jgi:hypothetical protein
MTETIRAVGLDRELSRWDCKNNGVTPIKETDTCD